MKPSSPRQCSHSPLGEMQEATKSPPSARPELMVLTTCAWAPVSLQWLAAWVWSDEWQPEQHPG